MYRWNTPIEFVKEKIFDDGLQSTDKRSDGTLVRYHSM